MLFSLLFWLQLFQTRVQVCFASASSFYENSSVITKPGCVAHCGDVLIPYPFGIGSNCYHDTWYEIVCNVSFHPPKPFLHRLSLEVIDIYWNGRDHKQVPTLEEGVPESQQIMKVIMVPQNVCAGGSMKPIDIRHSPYRFSRKDNVFLVEGCSGSVVLADGLNHILAECDSICSGNVSQTRTRNHSCESRNGCCLTPLGSVVTIFGYLNMSLKATVPPLSRTTCNVVASLIDNTSAQSLATGISTRDQMHPTTVLRWWATYLSAYSYENVTCVGSEILQTCYCNFPYQGNPYLPNGCQVARECQKCRDRCHSDLSGTYYCKTDPLAKVVGIAGGSFGLLLLCCVSLVCMYLCLKKRNLKKQKERFFQKNGGLLLKQQLHLFQGSNDSTRIFTSDELKAATKNYSQDFILGKGGYGTVYKGFLRDQVVAIKRSEINGVFQVEQFINEVVILTQVNHRNVVKLFGCCLKTEIPILVYEFVCNGSLYDQIHKNASSALLSWENCLRIATEAADAFAYLHSAASIPIIHRDIKSSNILLDENFMTKVSDFGASRLIPMDQTQVTTLAQGTLGYLDPEYFQTSHLSEKSDVYSFGVVLAELLTRRKPIIWERDLEERNLATHFLSAMGKDKLSDILEPRLMMEATPEQLNAIAILIEQCLSLKSEERPSMKEVARELNGLKRRNEKHGSVKQDEEKNDASVSELTGYHNIQCDGENSSQLYSMDEEMLTELRFPR